MKKVLKSLFVLLIFTFSSCTNLFKNGPAIRDELEEEIKIATAKELSGIHVQVEKNKHGQIVKSPKVFKLDIPFEIAFNSDPEYKGSFVRWDAFTNYGTADQKSVAGTKITFTDPLATSTTARIIEDVNNLTIVPLCSDYPVVNISIPASFSSDAILSLSGNQNWSTKTSYEISVRSNGTYKTAGWQAFYRNEDSTKKEAVIHFAQNYSEDDLIPDGTDLIIFNTGVMTYSNGEMLLNSRFQLAHDSDKVLYIEPVLIDISPVNIIQSRKDLYTTRSVGNAGLLNIPFEIETECIASHFLKGWKFESPDRKLITDILVTDIDGNDITEEVCGFKASENPAIKVSEYSINSAKTIQNARVVFLNKSIFGCNIIPCIEKGIGPLFYMVYSFYEVKKETGAFTVKHVTSATDDTVTVTENPFIPENEYSTSVFTGENDLNFSGQQDYYIEAARSKNYRILSQEPGKDEVSFYIIPEYDTYSHLIMREKVLYIPADSYLKKSADDTFHKLSAEAILFDEEMNWVADSSWDKSLFIREEKIDISSEDADYFDVKLLLPFAGLHLIEVSAVNEQGYETETPATFLLMVDDNSYPSDKDIPVTDSETTDFCLDRFYYNGRKNGMPWKGKIKTTCIEKTVYVKDCPFPYIKAEWNSSDSSIEPEYCLYPVNAATDYQTIKLSGLKRNTSYNVSYSFIDYWGNETASIQVDEIKTDFVQSGDIAVVTKKGELDYIEPEYLKKNPYYGTPLAVIYTTKGYKNDSATGSEVPNQILGVSLSDRTSKFFNIDYLTNNKNISNIPSFEVNKSSITGYPNFSETDDKSGNNNFSTCWERYRTTPSITNSCYYAFVFANQWNPEIPDSYVNSEIYKRKCLYYNNGYTYPNNGWYLPTVYDYARMKYENFEALQTSLIASGGNPLFEVGEEKVYWTSSSAVSMPVAVIFDNADPESFTAVTKSKEEQVLNNKYRACYNFTGLSIYEKE